MSERTLRIVRGSESTPQPTTWLWSEPPGTARIQPPRPGKRRYGDFYDLEVHLRLTAPTTRREFLDRFGHLASRNTIDRWIDRETTAGRITKTRQGRKVLLTWND